ncbi:MAG: thiamine biosynthesis lipoprotein [Paraglaciecola psychrophila]|jgi:thiamine biosynthesis lipoprotein
MGTVYSVTVLEPIGHTSDQEKLQLIIDTRLQTLNQQMSTYVDDSELSYLNRTPTDQPVILSEELFEVLLMSIELSWLSGGVFDITVGPLVDLWGFGPQQHDLVPTQSAIDEALAGTGYQHLQLNIADSSVSKTQPVSVDLSAIAKGYGVDKIAELLLAAGYKDFMVEIGGELRLQGMSPRGAPWKIAIEQPDGSFGKVHRAVSIDTGAMATSGDYRNYFEVEGQRYSHTIDPTTGWPIKHTLASVTVITESAAYADGLATAINVMGPERGLLFAEQQQLAVYLIINTEQGFEARFTEAFRPYLQ